MGNGIFGDGAIMRPLEFIRVEQIPATIVLVIEIGS
jgi:hypothetical protein